MPNPTSKESAQQASELGSDRPIVSRDQDRLGRAHFSKQLSRAIKNWNENESLVVAICGEWGIGKSSLKNLVLEELRGAADGKPEIIQFNPWQWKGHEGLSAAFFREVLALLSKKSDRKTREVARALRRYAAYLGVVKIILGGPKGFMRLALMTFGLLSIVPPLFITNAHAHTFATVLGSAALALAALVTWFEEILSKLAVWRNLALVDTQSLEERKQDVVSALRRYQRPILVVIDDIDRLTAAEIQAVFQLIKANADFPKFVYLVMYQRRTVEAVLKELTKESGRQFLEKIVQVSFDIPAARQDEVDSLLAEGVERILGTSATAAINPTYWGNVYVGALRTYFRDLRGVKRFLGSLEFHVNLLRTNGILEVNPVDLIAIETLRLFEPDCYQRIGESKGLLTGSRSSASPDRQRVADKIEAILSAADQNRKETLTEAIKTLFPTVSYALGGTSYSSDRYVEWNRDLRVCAPEIFDRYFQLGLSKGEIPQSEVERLIAIGANYLELKGALETLHSEGRLIAALDRLESNKTRILSENIVPTLTALFDIGEQLPEPQPGAFYGPDWTITRIAYGILKAEPESTRITKLVSVLNGTVGIRIPIMFIGVNTSSSENQGDVANSIIPNDDFDTLKHIGVDKIRNAAADGRLLDRHDLASLLFRWRDWADGTEPRQWVGNVTAGSPSGSLAFLRGFLNKGTSQTIGDHVARIRYSMRYSELESFADIEALDTEITKLTEARLSEDDRRVIQHFRKALTRKRLGKPEGTFGWDDD